MIVSDELSTRQAHIADYMWGFYETSGNMPSVQKVIEETGISDKDLIRSMLHDGHLMVQTF